VWGLLAGGELVEWERFGAQECEDGVAECVRVRALAATPARFGLVGGQVFERELVVWTDERAGVGAGVRLVVDRARRSWRVACLADRGADPVLDEPGRLVAAAEQHAQLVGRQSAVAVEDQRDRDEPLPEWQVRVVEDRA
jgi:hypothetical protein